MHDGLFSSASAHACPPSVESFPRLTGPHLTRPAVSADRCTLQRDSCWCWLFAVAVTPTLLPIPTDDTQPRRVPNDGRPGDLTCHLHLCLVGVISAPRSLRNRVVTKPRHGEAQDVDSLHRPWERQSNSYNLPCVAQHQILISTAGVWSGCGGQPRAPNSVTLKYTRYSQD